MHILIVGSTATGRTQLACDLLALLQYPTVYERYAPLAVSVSAEFIPEIIWGDEIEVIDGAHHTAQFPVIEDGPGCPPLIISTWHDITNVPL